MTAAMSEVAVFTVTHADEQGGVSVEVLADPSAALRRCGVLRDAGVHALIEAHLVRVHR